MISHEQSNLFYQNTDINHRRHKKKSKFSKLNFPDLFIYSILDIQEKEVRQAISAELAHSNLSKPLVGKKSSDFSIIFKFKVSDKEILPTFVTCSK